MTEKNESVFEYLNEYIRGDVSDFAVFLKGPWGCGKTYFIKKWIEDIEDNRTLENFDIIIKPLYISLYGLRSSSEITQSIRKALHPIWNSKTFSTIKKAALKIGSVALKYDLNGNSLSDKGEMSVNLDLLDLLNQGDDVKVQGKRILIFDDFERSPMPKDELLGYINNFVEHSSCYVIIIGDETKLTKTESKKFNEIKEKTIGREFSIEPNIDSAINDFIKEIGSTNLNLLKENKSQIVDLFKTIGINNLRILKHSLVDYSHCLSKFPNKDVANKGSYPKVIVALLTNFIICYMELLSSAEKKGNKEEIDLGDNNKELFSISKSEIQSNEDRKNYLLGIADTYRDFSIKYGISAPNINYCELIINYLYEGSFDIKAIVNEINVVIEQPIQYLCNLTEVTDEGFAENYPKVLKDYTSNTYKKLPDIYDGGAILIYYTSQGIGKIPYGDITGHALDMLELKDMPLSQLKNIESFIIRRNYYFSNMGMKKELDDFTNALRAKINEAEGKSQDDFVIYMENLDDESVARIDDMLVKPTPDRSTTYNMTSIFSKVDVNKVAYRILGLSNKGLRTFTSAVIKHYTQFIRTSNATDFIQNYADDIKPLKEISSLLTMGIDQAKPIKSLQIKNLSGRMDQYANILLEISHKATPDNEQN